MSERLTVLKRIAADTFRSATRRGWIANISEQDYVERFLEENKGADIEELETMADVIRPSSSLTV